MSKSSGLNNSLSFYNSALEYDKTKRYIIFNKVVPCVVFSDYGIIYFGAKDKNDYNIKVVNGNSYCANVVNLSQGYIDGLRFISGAYVNYPAATTQIIIIDDRTSAEHGFIQFGVLYPSSYGSISLRLSSSL